MKKGFTLIELLAVIVILAIIALIATPIILNIISDSKEESNKRSVELYGKAVEQAIAKAQLNGTEVQAGDLSEEFLKTVQYSGSEVTCTTNKLHEDGSIYLAGCNGEYTYGTRQQLDPGAYDDNNNLVADWDTLVNVYGLNLTENRGSSNEPIFRNEDLKNVTKLVIPEGVTIIYDFVFQGCKNLKSIIIPDSVTNIGMVAFSGTGITSITIPNSVTSIGEAAFASCENLKSITIPDSVTNIDDNAFTGCTNLTNATFNNPNGWTLDNGTSLNLTDPTTNATYLKNTYSSYSWNRS